MLRALYTSATGMKAQETMIDVTANNLANVNTNGFKRSQVDFADLLYSTEREAGTEIVTGQPAPIPLEIGSGVRPVGTTKSFTQGTSDPTRNPFDVAIQGEGFFKVTLPTGGDRYTRDGALRMDANGAIVTTEGYALDGGVTITPGATNIQIGKDGTVSGLVSGTPSVFGTLTLHTFANPAGLSSEGGNLYAETAASGAATQGTPGDTVGTLLQSHLERSNVQVVTELVGLITAQRAYEVNSRAIRAGDEMLSNMTDILR